MASPGNSRLALVVMLGVTPNIGWCFGYHTTTPNTSRRSTQSCPADDVDCLYCHMLSDGCGIVRTETEGQTV